MSIMTIMETDVTFPCTNQSQSKVLMNCKELNEEEITENHYIIDIMKTDVTFSCPPTTYGKPRPEQGLGGLQSYGFKENR